MKKYKRLLFLFIVAILFVLCSMNVCAEEHEIKSCKTTDAGALCDKLQSIYGDTSTIKYSTTETTICKYSTSVNIQGIQTTVYLSQKPTTGSVNIYMGEDGKLIIDGTGSVQAQPNDKVVLQNLFSRIHSIKSTTAGYPYNEINEKLLYVFGSGSNAYYFLDTDMDEIKTYLSDHDVTNIVTFIQTYFHKVSVSINGKDRLLYINVEPTEDQKEILSKHNGLDINEQIHSEDNNTAYFIVIIALGVIIACTLILLVWIVTKQDRIDKQNKNL